MDKIKYLSPAKINLFLHINSKRVDGYHNIQTIFQLLNFYDEITFSIRKDGKINRISENAGINPADDLLIKSAKAIKNYSNCSFGVDISINKKIPLGSGLGGGSSNAATSLIAINKLWKLNLDKQTLMDIGKKLGADVPIFIYGKNAFAQGIGDILTPINLPKYYYLVVYTNKIISTAQIFSHKALTMTPMQRKMTNFSMFADLHNDCLDAAIDINNDIKKALDFLNMNKNRITDARMTGTGCCVFAAFEQKQTALEAKKNMPDKWFSFVAKAIDISPSYNWAVAKR